MSRAGKILGAAALALISLVSLYPFYMMIMMSTYYAEDIFTGIKLLPGTYFPGNLRAVFASNFLGAYGNSLLVSLVATVVSVTVSAMAGYAMNIYTFRLRRAAYRLVLLTMMVPGQISIIGYMIQMRGMHLTNTLAPLMIVWFANGFGVFWMTQFIEGALPKEIVESARIDGSGELRTFFGIAVPCIVPAVTTLALLVFLWSWNQYMLPLVFINNPRLATIPIFVQSLKNAFRTDYGAQLAGLVLATVPLILLFILGSKSFIKGLTAGAVKG